MVMEQVRTYSAAALWELSHDADYQDQRLELSEGKLIVMSPASVNHGWIAMLLGIKVGNFVLDQKLGYVTAAETGFILHENPDGKDTVRAPDVGFIARERAPKGLPENGFFPGAPDAAFEVISPGDHAEEVQTKVNQYLKYGVRLIVIVYPASQTVNVYTQSSMKVLRIEDTLEGGDVLPGFSLPVQEIFKRQI